MKLYYQTHSPYARKTLVFAYEAGIAEDIEVVHCETSPTRKNKEIYTLNPLGKVPVLEVEHNQIIFESSLICEWFNSVSAAELIPSGINERIEALKIQALSDGLCSAGVLVRWESDRRPKEFRYKIFEDAQKQKIEDTLDFINGTVNFSSLHIGHIALASAVSWLLFRNVIPSLSMWPRLNDWYHEFSGRRSMVATELTGETFD